jgi:hypothetical protein
LAEIKSFPNNQDVYIGAEWVMKWLHGRTSGVFGAENNLSTSVVLDSMSVEVSDGVGWLSNANGDGIVFWNDSEQSNGSKLMLTHDVADGVLDRIDRIVVTWETTNYVSLPTISVLKGVASSNPVPPDLTNNNIQRQISLARVNIQAGTVSLSPSMITDERIDPDVCGVVTESVNVDTEMANAQFQELLKRVENNLDQILAEQIPDKSISRKKLANDALYSPAVNTTSRDITIDDIGCTLYAGNVGGTFTLTNETSKQFPVGAEIAIMRWDSSTDVLIAFDSTANVGISGNAGFVTAPTLRIPEQFNMTALKKIATDGSNDYWLVTGNVEVV